MATMLRVKNWERFQHYKQRNPPWIRLYNELLDDYEFSHLPDAAKYHAVGLWLLASRFDNCIPDDARWIGQRINATAPVDIPALLTAGFIERYDDASDVLARRKQVAMPEQSRDRREAEGETEKNNNAGSLDNDVEDFVSSVILRCNRGMIDNPLLTNANPILGNHPSRQSVFDWLKDGISRDAIMVAVYNVAKKYKPSPTNKQINSLSYCDGAVRREWETRNASSSPVPSGTVLNPESEAGKFASAHRGSDGKVNENGYYAPKQTAQRSGLSRATGKTEAEQRKEDDARVATWEAEHNEDARALKLELVAEAQRNPLLTTDASRERYVLGNFRTRVLAEKLTPKAHVA